MTDYEYCEQRGAARERRRIRRALRRALSFASGLPAVDHWASLKDAIDVATKARRGKR